MSDARLEVWGDPIAHSRSPQLHLAAYAALGLDWTFERRRVPAPEFDATLAGLDGRWRGLAVTMPLKEHAFRAAVRRNRSAELTGAVNTLFLADPSASGPVGLNTDVGGIRIALSEIGVRSVARARIVGAGATAASALVALGELGADRVDVVARRPERTQELARIGERAGVRVVASAFDAVHEDVDLTVATLPGGTQLPAGYAARLADAGGVLFDAAYAPWPSSLAAEWAEGRAHSGLGMLLHQAVLQVRVFTSGDVDAPLRDEAAVVAAMRSALMGD